MAIIAHILSETKDYYLNLIINDKKTRLTETKATLYLNSIEYNTYLDKKVHSIFSYQNENNIYRPGVFNRGFMNILSVEKWENDIKIYKTAEKARDKYILMVQGIIGLSTLKPTRREIRVNRSTSVIINKAHGFPYKERGRDPKA
jgi:hypothetical protein